nr:16S rRNA (cytosine(967)-C(5))-methyltransferase RsmB [Brevibacillus fulvus]
MDILTRVEEHRSYSNLELKQGLAQTELSAADVGLVTELVYGTIQRQYTLDTVISRFVKSGRKRLEPWVHNLLRLSLYQIRFLDRIPDRAAVHEAVELAKRKGHQGIASLVNGVLRNVLRQPEVWNEPQGNLVKRLAFAESHPDWLISRWLKLYGEELTRAICQSNNVAPHTSVRVNTLKTDRPALLAELKAEFPGAEASQLSPDGIVIPSGHVAASKWFQQGYCTIQDESSMLVARALAVQPGQRVLDACAAPGGKTSHLAELMGNSGQILACDVHPHKEKLIRETAKRLGITCIETVVSDALDLPDKGLGQFDRILLDAPCTGLGVIRRKPDLKWKKTPEDIAQISQLQARLLERIAPMLAPGGLLVYSTCTIEPEENQRVVEQFVAHHPEFEWDKSLLEDLPPAVARIASAEHGYVQILPNHFQSDGFFISRLKRSK